MTEPLPDAEWWPLKWEPEKACTYAFAEVHFDGYYAVVIDRFHEGSLHETPRYDVHYCKSGTKATSDTRIKLTETLFEVRPLLLKLAYPGGNYG